MNLGWLAMFGLPGGMEWVVILVVLLLLFGRRMPEVARSFGKSIVEFKRGMKDVREEINEATTDNKLDASRRPAQLEGKNAAAESQSSTPKTTAGSR